MIEPMSSPILAAKFGLTGEGGGVCPRSMISGGCWLVVASGRRHRGLSRLSQLELSFGNFAAAGCRLGQEQCAISRRALAKSGCGADQAPYETASGFGRLGSCFYATSFAATTARSTAIGA